MILVVAKVIQDEYTVLIGQFLLFRRNFIGEWLRCFESNSNHFGVRITLALPVPRALPRARHIAAGRGLYPGTVELLCRTGNAKVIDLGYS